MTHASERTLGNIEEIENKIKLPEAFQDRMKTMLGKENSEFTAEYYKER